MVVKWPQGMRPFLPQYTLKRFYFLKLLFYLVFTDLSHFIPILPFSFPILQHHFRGFSFYSLTMLVLFLPLLFCMPDNIDLHLSTANFSHCLVPSLMTFLYFAIHIVMMALILFMLCVICIPTPVNSSTYVFCHFFLIKLIFGYSFQESWAFVFILFLIHSFYRIVIDTEQLFL